MVDRAIVFEYLDSFGFNPVSFRKQFPELVVALGYSENQRYAKYSEDLYLWLHEMSIPSCQSPNCPNVPTFRGLTKGYDRFCSKKCTSSDAELKTRRLAGVRAPGTQDKRNITRSQKTEAQLQAESIIRSLGHQRRSVEKEESRRRKISANWKAKSREQIELLREKRHKQKLVNIISTIQSRIHDHVTALFNWDTFTGVHHEIKYNWRCKSCLSDFLDDLDDGKIPRCPICKPKQSNWSDPEKDVLYWLRETFPNLTFVGNQRILNRKEIDIFCPERNIGIEYCGSYYHSDIFKQDNYHLDKWLTARRKGIDLIFIMSYEWKHTQAIVKKRLVHLFGGGEKLAARDCQLVTLSSQTAKTFLDLNHLQGDVKASVRLGLISNEHLVAVMTFGGCRFNTLPAWELLRFASSQPIVGGASKLFNHFVKTHNPYRIISYADRRWSPNGDLYRKLGFALSETKLKPSFFFVDTSERRINRLQGSRGSLIYEGYDPNLKVSEIIRQKGWLLISDCGHWKFVWENQRAILAPCNIAPDHIRSS